MLRHATRFAGLLFVALLVSCATVVEYDRRPLAPEERDVEIEPPADEPMSIEEVDRLLDTRRLAPFEVAVIRAGGFREARTATVAPFYKTDLLVRIIDSLDVLDDIDPRMLQDLTSALFDDVPTDTDGVFRAVVVGRFFDNGAPLYLLLGSFPVDGAQAPEAALLGSERNIVIQTNAVAAPDGRVATGEGRFVSLSTNLSWDYLLFSDGVLAPRALQFPETAPESGSDDPLDEIETPAAEDPTDRPPRVRVRVAADYLLDHRRATTARIPPLVSAFVDDNAFDAEVRASAAFVMLRYRLFDGDAAGAREYLGAIETLAPALRDPEARRMAEVIAPLYINIYEAFNE